LAQLAGGGAGCLAAAGSSPGGGGPVRSCYPRCVRIALRVASGRRRGIRLARSLATGSAIVGLVGCSSTQLRTDRLGERMESGRLHGWVRTQSVDLVGVRARLELASSCRATPQPLPGTTVLRSADIMAARCRTRLFSGEIALTAITPQGDRTPLPGRVQVRGGQFSLSFTTLEQLAPPGGLGDYSFVEIGAGAWAGSINLESLRSLEASWHRHWVTRGRGSASLYVAAHPESPELGEVRALVVEAQLARQEADYLAVGRGELSARGFLDRHLWSPYRRSVREMRGLDATPRSAHRTRSSSP
jgi:hypothetical protein